MINRLKNSIFLRNIAILAAGSFIAQIISVLCAPILTRLYTPESLGTFTYIISLTTIFMGVINGRYDISIVTEKNEKMVIPLVQLSLIIGFIVSVLGTIGLSYLIFNQGLSIVYVVYVFFILLSYAIINPLTSYNNRLKEYKIISLTYTIRKTVQNIGSIIANIFIKNAHGLILPYVVGQYLGLESQSKSLRIRKDELLRIDKRSIVSVAKEQKNQLFFSTPAQLANSLSYSLITIVITSLYGLSIVGYYSISVKLLGLPLALIGGNISKVFIENASVEYRNTNGYRRAFNKTFLFLFIISIPLVLLLYFFSPVICELFLGKGWGISGTYIRILAPMFGVRFITSALSPALIIVQKQKIELILQGLFLLFNLIGYIIAMKYSLVIESFLLVINLLFMAAYGLYLFMIFYYSKPSIEK